MMFGWKTKRERQLEELLAAYQEREAARKADEERRLTDFGGFTGVAVPGHGDQAAYQAKIAALVDDPLMLFYLVQLRRSVVDDFQQAVGQGPDYYRGMLAVVGRIIEDARKAKNALAAGQV